MATKVLKASLIIGGAISSSLKSGLLDTQTGLQRIGGTIGDLTRKQRALGNTLASFSGMRVKNIDQLHTQYGQLSQQLDRLRHSYAQLDRIEKARAANLANRRNIGGALMGSIGTIGAVGYSLSRTVGNAAAFNRENQLIGNTADMTRQQVAALGKTILAEARITNQGANEVQRAIGFLVAAGMDAQTAQASIRTIGRTTTAAGADIEDLSRAAFTLQDAFKIKPGDLQGALDILAVAGKEGNVELKDMAKVLPVLGSSFVALKMEGREAAATMGAALEIARKGAADPDEAANNMKNFLGKVLSPETLKKAESKFGLDLYTVIKGAQTKGGNPFEAAMTSIMEATKGDQKAIGELFQDAQVQNFLRPMMQNWDEYQRIKDKALNQSAGTTDRDFALMMETDAEKMKAAKIAADNLSKAFGTALSPAIGSLAGSLAGMMDRMTVFVQENPKLVATTTKLVVGMLAMRTAVLGLRFAWTFVRGPILGAMKLFHSFRAGTIMAQLGRFGPVAMRAASAFRLIGTAVAAIGGGPITLAIAAITAGALVVRRYWEPIKAFLGGVWEGLTEAGGVAMGELLAAVEPLRPAWEAVGGLLREAWGWLSNLIGPAKYSGAELANVAAIGKLVGQSLFVNFRIGTKAIGIAVQSVVWLGEALGTAAGWIVTSLGSVWDKVKGPAGAAIDWIMAKLQPLLDGIGWLMDKVGGGLGFAASKIIGAQQAVLTNAASFTAPMLPAPVSGRPAPAIPAPVARSGAGQVQHSQTNHITINQQPGESSEALARRTADELQRRQAIAGRSGLGDR